MTLPVYLYSAKTLQNWNPDTPWKTGIGGSETAHIEMYNQLSSDNDFTIRSFCPLNDEDIAVYPKWSKSEELPRNKPALIINYRDFALYDQKFHKKTKHWFVAQDVDYNWTEERLAKIDRYITLCDAHSQFTLAKYPSLRGKVFQSSNGVRGEYIKNLWNENKIIRNAKQVIYASSPDRGLQLLLEQWWRIRERVEGAELVIAYGFENTNKIIELMGGRSDFHQGFKAKLLKLFKQPGVKWLGRLPQGKLYEKWFESNVWAYPCNFAETSCITCMDAQACGTIPVTNNLWALADNVLDEYPNVVLPELPQANNLTRSYFTEHIIDRLNFPENEYRHEMALNAIEKFDWKKIAQQWKAWIEEDIN
jgi:glycosyltransferase involved in cell wall biosynthesis